MFQRLTRLFRDVAIFGVGDMATSIVSFLLLPIYTHVLTAADYGVIALLLTIEAGAKVVLRWGVDSAFMRLYYECADERGRQTLASTLFFFLLAANGPFLIAGLALAPQLGALLFRTPAFTLTLRLFILNTFIVGFFFIPFHVLRIEGRTSRYTTLTFSRAVATIVARLLLVLGFRMGVLGVVVADVIVTAASAVVLSRWVTPLVRLRFSRAVIADALGFGLPRVPHGIGQQAVALADRYVLNAYASLREVGIYSIGVSFGLAMKLFLSAFEYAWAPFYLEAMNRPDAKRIYSQVTTYVAAILVLLAIGLAVTSNDLVRLMTAPQFYGAARVIPLVGLGVMLQGFYQLTAIGLNITKRTGYLPLATGAALAVSLGLNLLLVPRVGMIGAAWAYVAAYGTLAAAGTALSQRVYPVKYEWRRLGLIAASGVVAYVVASSVVPRGWPTLVALMGRGSVTVCVYPAMLYLTGFFRPGELRRLVQLRQRLRPRPAQPPETDETELAGEIVGAPSMVSAQHGDTRRGA